MVQGRDYAEILTEYGVQYRETRYWAHVSSPMVKQGWKFHLTATPTQAEALLGVVLPYLRDQSLCFKIARDCSVLEALNAGGLGPTQVGKFITIYPLADRVQSVAEDLRRLTSGFQGPSVPCDLKLGSIVSARYGAFVAQYRRDRLGLFHRQLQWPDGSMHDDVYEFPLRLPDGISNPFIDMVAQALPPSARVSTLRAAGYLVVDVLRTSAKGATFMGLSLQDGGSVRPAIIKQARPLCMSDRYGRDARSRLARERDMHRMLADIDGVPRVLGGFEDDSGAYLAVEHIEGRSLEEVVADTLQRRPWARCSPVERQRLLDMLLGLTTVVGALHARGVVHRDLSNTNIRVASDGRVFVLDLEMAQALDDNAPVTGSGTIGFRSPQQEADGRQDLADDIHALSAIILLTLCGIDPRRLLHAGADQRIGQICDLTGDAEELLPLIPLAARGLAHRPSERPLLEDIADGLRTARSRLTKRDERPVTRRRGAVDLSDAQLSECVEGAIHGILCSAYRAPDGLWLSPPLGAGDQGAPKDRYEKLRSAHSGAAGILYTLAEAARWGWADVPTLIAQAGRSAEWLRFGGDSRDTGLPGLHFGEAGIAVALDKATTARIVQDTPALQITIRAGLAGPLDWPDFMHGAAGQGIAALIAAPDLAARCADYLMETQQKDGSWIVPEGVPNVSGQKLTGFAHGVAGIVYFLAEFALRQNVKDAVIAMRAGIDWLSMQALDLASPHIAWPYSDRVDRVSQWWCHGAPGISLAYLKAHEVTGEADLLDIATRALEPEIPDMRYGNVSFCHGLSGLGEMYLEAYRVSRSEHWYSHARGLLTPLLALGRKAGAELTWTVEDPLVVTADLGLGGCGPLHFLLRLLRGPDAIPLPLTVPAKGAR